MVSEPANTAPADATRTQGLQSLGSPAAPSLHSEILAAFAHQTPLPKIIADLHLSPEDLHNFLSTPGIPERLSALRALVRFDRDLRHTAAQADAVSYLQNLLKATDTTEVEGRRAATALLRGPSTPSASRTPSPKSDISDWAELPPDDVLDDEDDDDTEDNSAPDDAPADLDTESADDTDSACLDEPAESIETAHAHPRPVSTGRGVRGSARTERGVPVSEPAHTSARKPTKPTDAPQLPLTATPDELISHQLSLIQTFSPPNPTPRDILHALDFHRLSFPTRAYADLKQSFLAKIPTNLLDISNATLIPDPATIHDTTPPTATARVTIKPQNGPATSFLFHLRHESTFPNDPNDPNAPHAWHTTAITQDTS